MGNFRDIESEVIYLKALTIDAYISDGTRKQVARKLAKLERIIEDRKAEDKLRDHFNDINILMGTDIR